MNAAKAAQAADFSGACGVLRARAGRAPTRLPDSPGGAEPDGPRGCPGAQPYWSEPSLDTRIMMNSTNAQIPFAAMISQARMNAPPRVAISASDGVL